MYSGKRNPKPTLSRIAELDASRVAFFENWYRNRDGKRDLKSGDVNHGQDCRSRSDPGPHGQITSLAPKPKHPADGKGRDDSGRSVSFHDTSRNPLAPFEAAVKKSRRAFVEKLVEYHATLACAITAAPDADQSEPFVDEAMFVAHRIAGVGKTLGYPELGEAARRAEAAIAAYEKELGSAEQRSVCHTLLCQLASIIEAICADHDDCHGRLRPRT